MFFSFRLLFPAAHWNLRFILSLSLGDLFKTTILLIKWINGIITTQNTNVPYILAPIQSLVMDHLRTFNVGMERRKKWKKWNKEWTKCVEDKCGLVMETIYMVLSSISIKVWSITNDRIEHETQPIKLILTRFCSNTVSNSQWRIFSHISNVLIAYPFW